MMNCTVESANQVLLEKLDNVLASYPTYPYQVALSNEKVKQLLLDYVEVKLKQVMPSLQSPGHWRRLPHYLSQLVDLELRLDSYIYWGIEYIIQNQLELLVEPEKLAQPSWSVEDMTQTCMPSYWFG
ncbi:hypothetical protein [Leptothoe kymatousa]|uniref:Uncharacterized protein n=1 Tax=Leptothoe kymatousa TAU-MAC 1615 TaxID=2364775 RepID=A0ABS5Y7M5_9CYAN|nr:hypothetical protein [Leptothoe kymatousa]MBT9312955.1 hypothetical protein [Leptothoe kymatousa TAU-MAC 1615]